MNQKKWVIGVASALVVVLAFGGFMAIAAEVGSKEDPVVAVSYINEELVPMLGKKIDEAISSKTEAFQKELDSKMEQFIKDMAVSGSGAGQGGTVSQEVINAVADQVAGKLAASGGASGANFAIVEVAAGKTLNAKRGAEILLRLGSATCVASGNPGLIDLTNAGELAGGKALEKNHLYLVTVDGDRGFKAVDKVTVFVRGLYEIK